MYSIIFVLQWSAAITIEPASREGSVGGLRIFFRQEYHVVCAWAFGDDWKKNRTEAWENLDVKLTGRKINCHQSLDDGQEGGAAFGNNYNATVGRLPGRERVRPGLGQDY